MGPAAVVADGRERALVVEVFVYVRPVAVLDDDDDDDECRLVRLVVVVIVGGAGAKDFVRANAAAKGVEAPADSDDRVAEEFLRFAAAETVSREKMEGEKRARAWV